MNKWLRQKEPIKAGFSSKWNAVTNCCLPKLNNPRLFASSEGSVPSIYLSTCSVWIKWARTERRQDGLRVVWLRLFACAWETAKRDRASRKLPEWGVGAVCVFRGGEDERCQHFFLRVPISICIISIQFTATDKERTEMLVQPPPPELTREQWRREGSFSGAGNFQNGGLILSFEVLPQLGRAAVLCGPTCAYLRCHRKH